MAIGIHKKPIQRPIKLETPLEYMTEKTLKMLLYKLSITDAAHTRIFVSHQRIVRPSPNIAPMSQYSILETIHSINDNQINLLSKFLIIHLFRNFIETTKQVDIFNVSYRLSYLTFTLTHAVLPLYSFTVIFEVPFLTALIFAAPLNVLFLVTVATFLFDEL